MAVELTRMDFHVLRFMDSNDVEDMTASEVGQYCLLLFKAWLGAKDVTLPVDEKRLAKYARVKHVSPLVLKQFPIVETKEWGQCRRNKVQLQVWWTAKARSEAGKAGAAGRWEKEHQGEADADTTAMRPQSESFNFKGVFNNATAKPSVMPKENRAEQSKPTQYKPTQLHADNIQILSLSQIEKLDFPNDLPAKKAWRRCEEIWRQVKREKLISLGNRFSEFERWVENQGSAHVIAAFDLYARESDGFNPKFGGSAFLKNIESHLDAVRIMTDQPEPDAARESEDAFRTKLQEQNDRKEKELRAREKQEAAEAEATRDLI
jgi:uncharacterized protein YdaU (DUF1376 family)